MGEKIEKMARYTVADITALDTLLGQLAPNSPDRPYEIQLDSITDEEFGRSYNQSNLSTIDRTSLHGVLYLNPKKYVDLSWGTSAKSYILKNVNSLGSAFNGCSTLVGIDTAPFANVVEMQASFYSNTNLRKIDCSVFTLVRDITNAFSYCRKLEYIDTSAFTRVNKINSAFAHCDSLKEIDLSPFQSAITVDTGTASDVGKIFLETTNLQKITLPFRLLESMLKHLKQTTADNPYDIVISDIAEENVQGVESGFIDNTINKVLNENSDRYINLYWGTNAIKALSGKTDWSYAFKSCWNIVTLDCSALKSMVKGYCCFQYCVNLTNLINMGFDNVTNGEYMFRQCKMTTLDMSSFKNILNMTRMFMDCQSLVSLTTNNAEACAKATTASYCFYRTTSLKTIEILKNMVSLANYSTMFYSSTALEEVDISSFKNSSSLWELFYNCNSLKHVIGLEDKLRNARQYGFTFANCFAFDFTDFDWSLFSNKSNDINLQKTFLGCKLLKEVDTTKFTNNQFVLDGAFTSSGLETFDTSHLTKGKAITNLFKDCTKLKHLIWTFDVGEYTNYKSSVSGINDCIFYFPYDKFNEYTAEFNDVSSDVSFGYAVEFDKLYDVLTELPKNTINTPYNICVMNVPSNAFAGKYCEYLTNKDNAVKGTLQYALINNDTKYVNLRWDDNTISTANTIETFSHTFGTCTALRTLDERIYRKAKTLNSVHFRNNALLSFDCTKVNRDIKSLSFAWFGCLKISYLDTAHFNADTLTDIGHAFQSCPNLRALETSSFRNAKKAQSLFFGTPVKNIDCRDFKSVEDGSYMFGGNSDNASINPTILNNDISPMKNLKIANSMFVENREIQSLKGTEVLKNCYDLNSFFRNCINLKFIYNWKINIDSLDRYDRMFENVPQLTVYVGKGVDEGKVASFLNGTLGRHDTIISNNIKKSLLKTSAKPTAMSQARMLRLDSMARFPYLMEIITASGEVTRFANTDDEVEWDNQTYYPCSFNIVAPDVKENSVGNGNITMSAIDQTLIMAVRKQQEKLRIRFVAVIEYEDDFAIDTIEAMEDTEFKLANVTWDDLTISGTLIFDDLMDVNLPCDVSNSQNCPALV